nr:MAG: hypothetical protein DIU60_08170 [Actinomycetota bacterium]
MIAVCCRSLSPRSRSAGRLNEMPARRRLARPLRDRGDGSGGRSAGAAAGSAAGPAGCAGNGPDAGAPAAWRSVNHCPAVFRSRPVDRAAGRGGPGGSPGCRGGACSVGPGRGPPGPGCPAGRNASGRAGPGRGSWPWPGGGGPPG